jgi:hypothetical protein
MSVIRRTLAAAVAVAAVAGTTLAAVPASAVVAAPPAPKGLTVVRDGSNPHSLKIDWKPVAGINNYMVRVNDGTKDTNLIIPSDKTTATYEGSGDCTSYRVAVSAVIDQNTMGTTGVTFVQSLGPGSVSHAKGSRNNPGTGATVTWDAPSRPGAAPVTGYKVQVKQVSNGNVVSSGTQSAKSISLNGLDPERMYSVRIAAENSFGSCVTSNVVLGNNRPSAPEFTVVRPVGQPSWATVTWRPTTWGGYGPVTGYKIGYKRINQSGYTWIDAGPSATSRTIEGLDPTVNWTFVMRAVNGPVNGLLSKTFTLFRSGYDPVNANVTISGTTDTIVVDFSAAVGSATNYPTARIDIAKDNGTKGWSDRHSVTNQAGRATFSPVPCGTYEVVVTGVGGSGAKEMVRTTQRVCEQPAICFTSTLKNGSFETPVIPNSTYRILPTSTAGLEWNNTAENNIELWSTGYSNNSGGKVTAADGRQLAELNANKAGTLYQDLPTTPGTTMRWHLKHRGRAGSDTMRVMVGAPGNLKQSGPELTTDNKGWVQYTDSYTIPAGQTTTRFAFQAVRTASSISVGNFLDDIVFTPEACQ